MITRAFLACLAACAVSRAGAQEDSSAALPVTVKVAPAYAFSGMAFTVTGTSVPYGDAHTVAITVTRIYPAPKPGSEVSATATMDNAGTFTATINHPFEWGRYRVRVTAPDQKGADSAMLTLYDTPEVPDETAKALDSVVTASSKALAAAVDLVAALPASPAKLRYQDSLAAAQRRVKEWATQREALKAALTKMGSVPLRFPAAAQNFQPMFAKVSEVANGAHAKSAEIESQLSRSAAAGVTCDRLDQAIEQLKLFSAGMNFVSDGIKSVVKAFGIDYGADAFRQKLTPASLQNDSRYAFALNETFKFTSTIMLGPEAWPVAVVALAADLGAFAKGQEFEKYCEKIEGPMSGTMHAEYYRDGHTWWSYDVAIGGKLILRYAKGASLSATHVTGEFVGTANHFAVTEDALAVLYPVTRKTSTMLRKLVVPPGQGYNEAEGKTFAGTSPFGFIVPVEGDITGGDKLTLRFLAAQTDLSDAIAAHVVYVLIGPMILAPIVVKYDLPFQTAAFILGRAVEDKPAELAVTVTRNAMVIDHTFNRTRPGDNNKGIYMLKIRACNPSCS